MFRKDVKEYLMWRIPRELKKYRDLHEFSDEDIATFITTKVLHDMSMQGEFGKEDFMRGKSETTHIQKPR